ncbi:hypothetical protein [Spirosoma endophyticum]|uniref:Uncharacterized protein n=1 Tax=Spirosoma endophyticum TaxID=662367 RepID=A0A1I2IDS1_9BACT|nr:hypothetical protein [Spirosoma endophyticum]SFF39237.1 hypothetical protein SAMN05216167_1631 [Spirosoma endophyticum]
MEYTGISNAYLLAYLNKFSYSLCRAAGVSKNKMSVLNAVCNNRTDFYDLNKRMHILFIMISVFSDAGENS